MDTDTLTGVVNTQALIQVSSPNTDITSGAASEKRTIIATGLVDGNPFQILHPFLLVPFQNHGVVPADVRKFIGCDEGELPDDEVDLTGAYLDLAEKMTLTLLDAGTITYPRSVDQAVLAQAVLNLMPSLPIRISKSESDGTSKVERFPIDLNLVANRAMALLSSASNIITSTDATTRTLIALTTRTDPITGV